VDILDDGKWLLDIFLNPPIDPLLKVYFFNMTNSKEFLELNEKPVFNEVGPYVYNEKWIRDDQQLLAGGVIEFVPKKLYRFVPRKSEGHRQTDRITTVNVPFLTLLHQIKYGPSVLRQSVNSLLDVLNQDGIQSQFVRPLLWGAPNDLVKLGRDVMPDKPNRYPYEEFGLLIGTNDTDSGKMQWNSGLEDQSQTNRIISWKGQSQLGTWQIGTQCDTVKGSSDGLLSQPGITKKDRIFLFNKDLCRTFALDFEKEVEYKAGIRGYRFALNNDLAYGSPDEQAENRCYCVDGSCSGVKRGVFNATKCYFGAPIMLSNPHFLDADESLRKELVGMDPRPNVHESYLDIEPVTGLLLRSNFKIQMNVAMNSAKSVKRAKGFRDIILPIMYVSQETDGLTDPAHLKRLQSIIQKRRQA